MTRPYFDEIDQLYRSILRRPVDPSGYATYSVLLARGKLSLEKLSEILVQSEEFMRLAHQATDTFPFRVDSTFRPDDRWPESSTGLSGRGFPCVAVTIASKRYIANARVTASSFRRHHPEIPFVLLLADDDDGYLEPAKEPFDIVTLDAIGIPDLHQFVFRYGELEFSYAATPFLVKAMLAAGYPKVIFLKQETLVLGNLTDLIEALDNHPLFVTPHLLASDGAGEVELELKILRAGVFNAGIFGVSDTLAARMFVNWWCQRIFGNAYCRPDDGLHFEQRWLDFLPAMVPDALIVRDPGVNIAHWNLLARELCERDGHITARGMPVRVFRFSGYDAEHPERVSRYGDLQVKDTGASAEIFRTYHAMLLDAGYEEARTWPYAIAAFDNGVSIPDVVRRIYRDLGEEVVVFGDPRANADAKGSFYQWLKAPASHSSNVSNLWQAIHRLEPIVQRNFPAVEDLGTQRFAAWWRRHDPGQNEIPEALFPRPTSGSR